MSVRVIAPVVVPVPEFDTVTEYEAGSPFTKAVLALLDGVRFGATTLIALVVLRLFAVITSPALVTSALFVSVPSALAPTLATIDSVTSWPEVSAGCAGGAARVHVTIWRAPNVPVTLQANVVPGSPPLTNVSPAGSVSTSVIAPVLPPVPALVPDTFESVSVNVVFAPTLIGPAPVLVSEKSGTLVTGSGEVTAVSLLVTKSPGVVTEALFVTVG